MRIWIATLVLAFAADAFAEEPPKVRKARYDSELEKRIGEVNAKCGTKLTAAIDWASFDKDEGKWSDKSIASYCEAPLNALERFCEGESSRAYIKKTLETLTCHAAKDKASWKAAVDKGHLHWHVSPDASNNDDYARAQLLKNL
jgi:hypothetical protein